MSRRFFPQLLVALALLLPLTLTAGVRAQTVLQRARLGSYAEEIDFVRKGALANHVVMIEGYEVWGYPGQARGRSPLRKLFDLRALDIKIAPRGIAHVESEKLFAVNDPRQPTKLFLTDHRGRPAGTRAINYLDGYQPNHVEGLAYLPAESPVYPDHLVMATWDAPGLPDSRLHVIRRDGQVVAEIHPAFPAPPAEPIGGVAFLAPDRLLVTLYDETVWTFDLAGNLLAGPLSLAGTGAGGGVVQLADGRVAVAAFPQRLLFLDRFMNRLPEDDRDDRLGLLTPTDVSFISTGPQAGSFAVVDSDGGEMVVFRLD